MDSAAADALPAALQLCPEPRRGLSAPTGALTGHSNSLLVCLHWDIPLHRKCHRLVFCHGCSGRWPRRPHGKDLLCEGRPSLAWLRHLGSLLPAPLLLSLHHGGDGTHGSPKDRQSVHPAQSSRPAVVHRSERTCSGLDIHVCVYLCVLPRPVSEVGGDPVCYTGLACDLRGVVSEALVPWSPSAPPAQTTETTSLVTLSMTV